MIQAAAFINMFWLFWVIASIKGLIIVFAITKHDNESLSQGINSKNLCHDLDNQRDPSFTVVCCQEPVGRRSFYMYAVSVKTEHFTPPSVRCAKSMGVSVANTEINLRKHSRMFLYLKSIITQVVLKLVQCFKSYL